MITVITTFRQPDKRLLRVSSRLLSVKYGEKNVLYIYIYIYIYIHTYTHTHTHTHTHTECNRRHGPDFGRVFFRSYYTDITQNTYIQSSMVTEILAREV